MTPPRARIARVTEPQTGVYVFMFQLEGQEGCTRVEITKAQLGGIVSDGASMAFRASAKDTMKEWLVRREEPNSIDHRVP